MRILPTRCHFNGKCVCTAYKFTKLLSGSIRDNAKPDIVISMASEIKYFQATALADSAEPSSALRRLVIYYTSLMSAHNITSSATLFQSYRKKPLAVIARKSC